MPRNPKFKRNDIVSHIMTTKYYCIIRDLLDGSYSAKDCDLIDTQEYVFREEYLQSKQERRSSRIDDIFK